MSYTPLLIINKVQLEKALEKLVYVVHVDYGNSDEDIDERVKSYLLSESNADQNTVIQGVGLIICRPEMTYFNEAVRDTLYDWDVEFATHN